VEATAATPRLTLPRSPRLLAALGDDRLVEEARYGSEVAFEVIYERYHAPAAELLSPHARLGGGFRGRPAHLRLGVPGARAETGGDSPPALLYAIARNRCISVLRGRREQPLEEIEPLPTAGLSEEVDQRSELRELLADVRNLPESQRAALVLSEVADLEHPQIAEILECEAKKVKALIFRARSSLIASREAREVPSTEIPEQLATARAGALRRTALRRHLKRCPGCAEFAEDVRRQRAMLAVALPVVPSLGLKESALAAAGRRWRRRRRRRWTARRTRCARGDQGSRRRARRGRSGGRRRRDRPERDRQGAGCRGAAVQRRSRAGGRG